MGEYLINDTTLVSIADAIREKVGSSDGIDPANMAEMIAGIQSGGGGGGVATGSYVFAETRHYAQITDRVEHGLGRVPTHMIQLLKLQDGAIMSGGYRVAYIYIDEEGAIANQATSSSGFLKVMMSASETFSKKHSPTERDLRLFGAYTSLYSPDGNAGEEVLWFVW